MSRIFVTGDVHGSIELKKLSYKNFPLGRELTKNDIVIICGDAGFMWDNSKETKYWDDWAEDRNFTILACLGNHENYDAIRALPAKQWNSAIVRKVRPHVMYIENGEILNLNDKSYFFMGGATSVDKAYRTEGKSWWSQEIPSYSEMSHAVDNLATHNNQVDYIITHCAPNAILDNMVKQFVPEHDAITNFLEKCVKQEVDFRAWMCGHYHFDRSFNNFHALYNDIIEICENERIEVVN